MKTLIRLVLVLVSGVSTLYFVLLVGGAILIGLPLPHWLSLLVSIVAAVAVGRYVWLRSASVPEGLISSIVLGAVILGGVGFAGGFFGPIIFNASGQPRATSAFHHQAAGSFLALSVGAYWFAGRPTPAQAWRVDSWLISNGTDAPTGPFSQPPRRGSFGSLAGLRS
jgi:hypothetical protein